MFVAVPLASLDFQHSDGQIDGKCLKVCHRVMSTDACSEAFVTSGSRQNQEHHEKGFDKEQVTRV